jgi:hypothetical protein
MTKTVGCPAGPEPKCYLGGAARELIAKARKDAMEEAAALAEEMLGNYDTMDKIPDALRALASAA